ncbi:hypothetical protein LQ757_10145 [Agromyces sp. SYSU K20354]|uniref:hypothetical protein n=1 Tax=Agromyces cavernae TaxID=2898659 RepID=UPI001E4AF998|nr:hypothetical protein [Agromyces cavernae]MCD2442632.1 hypothetical protein [Agromyces cavernae]
MATIAAAVVALTGCTAGPDSSASPDGGGSGGCGTEVPFDAQNFVDPTLNTNPYYPTKPGLQWVRGGSTLVGGREVPYEVISTMTDVIRIIDGVPAIAMLDEGTDSGEINQVGIDYFALDRDGNVWILGAYTEDYEGGEYTNTEDAWLGAAEGQTLGILAPAEVTIDTPMWCIGEIPGEDGEVGMPAEVGVQECVAFGCYDDVRVVQEGTAGAPDNENKYYAPGVGVIKNVPLDASIHKDRFELLNFVELSPSGLTEASNLVLDLEAHARESAAPDVYGSEPVSTRAE